MNQFQGEAMASVNANGRNAAVVPFAQRFHPSEVTNPFSTVDES